jgi:pimeloyl-ACP methyl ester carboxylesterase
MHLSASRTAPQRGWAASLAVLAGSLSACASLPATDTVAVGSATIAYARGGQGGPPIVFQSGLGDDRAPWAEVFRGLAGRHTVLAYDRPGYGGSSGAAPGPRDPCSVAAEMRAVLAAAGLKPPYVLVGHSLGGLYQHAFAQLYPGEVAGLVLLDPTHPRHWETLQREAPAAASVVRALRATVFTAAARREFDDQARCLDRLDTPAPRPVPTQILVSTRFSALEGPEFQRMVKDLRNDWLRLSGAAGWTPVANSGHYIQRDAPATVVHAVEELAARVGAQAQD